MKSELNVYELGKILKELEERYKLAVLIKLNLSGGWMTITGEPSILKIPSDIKAGCGGKDNIIDINIKNASDEKGTSVKITGVKDKKFNVDISSTRYKEFNSNNININVIKINENESKLRIDEDIIFTIKASVDEIKKIMED